MLLSLLWRLHGWVKTLADCAGPFTARCEARCERISGNRPRQTRHLMQVALQEVEKNCFTGAHRPRAAPAAGRL